MHGQPRKTSCSCGKTLTLPAHAARCNGVREWRSGVFTSTRPCASTSATFHVSSPRAASCSALIAAAEAQVSRLRGEPFDLREDCAAQVPSPVAPLA